MNTKINDFYTLILNKKFGKKITAGYNSVEVDEFLDEILKFFKTISKDFDAVSAENRIFCEKNKELKDKINKLKSENSFLETRINDILKDGYQSHQMWKDISDLKKRVNGDK